MSAAVSSFASSPFQPGPAPAETRKFNGQLEFLHFGAKTMAVPRSKMSPMKRGQRRSHDALTAPVYVEDKESGERRRPHHIDMKSGKYRGRQILAPKADV